MSHVLRNLPSVSELLESPPLKSIIRQVNRNVVISKVRRFLDDLRGQVQGAAAGLNIPSPGELAERIAAWIAAAELHPPAPAINATGVLLPSGFGGPPLAEEAILAAHHLAQGYVRVGDDPATQVEQRLTELTGAEAAVVTTCHSAAVVAALAALATGREVIVARGEVVELDDGTRTADVVAASGAVLREVGSANKTRPADFAAAIGDKTAVLLRIHDVQMPFAAAETTLADLASLARKHQVPLVFDLGPGGLIDLAKYGIEHQPLAAGAIAAGADVVLLRGDKLLGGPRCGVLAGRAAAIGTIRRHGLFSAMQAGPLTLAALGETLRLYGDSELAERSIPLLSLLATPVENLRNRAERVAPQIAASGVATASVIDSQARLFGGPGIGPVFPSVGIALTPARGSAAALAASLSSRSPALVGRLEADRWVLDLRGVLPRQDIELVSAFEALAPPKEDEPPPLPDPIA